MKRVFSSIVVLAVAGLCGLLPATATAQIPAWQMALAMDTPAGGSATINSTAVDASGNVYMIGTFSGTTSFGTTTLNSAGSIDIFVAKWSPTSGFKWVQQVGGAGEETGWALAVSGNSVYVVGQFTSPILSFGTTTLTNSGGTDGLVAKLVDNGNTSTWAWAQPVGGTNEETAVGVAVSGNSVYVTGDFGSPTLSLGAKTLTNAGVRDGFVAKLEDRGSTSTWTWAQPIGGLNNEGARAVAVSGNTVYVTGSFDSQVLPVGAATLLAAGGADIYVAKLVDSGSTSAWVWATQMGGSALEFAYAFAVSGNSIYVVGQFASPTLTVGPTTLTNAGIGDGFVAKLEDSGSTSAWRWVQQVGGPRSEAAKTVTISGNNVLMTGVFNSPSLTIGLTTLTTAATTGFLAAFSDPLLSVPAAAVLAPLTLAPNPASGRVAVRGMVPGSQLIVLDGQGRTVLTAATDATGATTLDVRTLAPGLYLVQGNGGAGQRLMVE